MDIRSYCVVAMALCEFYKATGQTPPGPPRNISLISDAYHIGVEWLPPKGTGLNDVIRKYVVSWSVLPNRSEVLDVINGNVTMAIISVTEFLGRMFRMRVRAANYVGIGPYSRPKYLRTKCGESFSVSPEHNVSVTSPGFYKDKPLQPDLLCKWSFQTYKNYSIVINITEIDFVSYQEPLQDCSLSFVSIENDIKVCSMESPRRSVNTNKSNVTVVLRTGNKAGGNGIKFSVKSTVKIPGPPENIKLRTLENAVMLSWQPPVGMTLFVTSYNIRYCVLATQKSFMVTVSKSMRQYTVNTKLYEGRLIQFNISALIGKTEGRLSKTLYARAPCYRRVFVITSDDVNITSPGYPRAYPSSIVCIWFVSSTSDNDLTVTYLDFRLQDTTFCSSDYVVFSFTPYHQPECSQKLLPVVIDTNSKNFTLKFVTDSDSELEGFLLRISSSGPNKANVITSSIAPYTTSARTSQTSTSQLSTTSVLQTTSQTVTTNRFSFSKRTSNSSKSVETTTNLFVPFSSISTKTNSVFRPVAAVGSQQMYSLQKNTAFKLRGRISAKKNITVTADPYVTSYALRVTTSWTVTTVGNKTNADDNNYGWHSLNHTELLTTSVAVGVVLVLVVVLAVCCFYRRKRRIMKVDLRQHGKEDVNTHELFRQTLSRPTGFKQNYQRRVTAGVNDRIFPPIKEVDENVVPGLNERCRRNTFPTCPPSKRRKVYKQIKRVLKTFDFIEDLSAIERTLERKARHRRANSA